MNRKTHLPGLIRCPQSDSNRHWTDFKSAASANWAMGARRRMYRASAGSGASHPPKLAKIRSCVPGALRVESARRAHIYWFTVTAQMTPQCRPTGAC